MAAVDETPDLAAAFPATLNSEARVVLDLVPDSELKPLGWFVGNVDGECVRIPYRIYNAEPTEASVARLTPLQQTVLHCLYTRHHDGKVRQRHLEQVIATAFRWVVPYVVQLIGEYVVEILEVIADRLDLETRGSADRVRYGRFVAENAEAFETTSRRVTSYWNCYYRFRFPIARPRDNRFATYPGFMLVDALSAAAREIDSDEGSSQRAGDIY